MLHLNAREARVLASLGRVVESSSRRLRAPHVVPQPAVLLASERGRLRITALCYGTILATRIHMIVSAVVWSVRRFIITGRVLQYGYPYSLLLHTSEALRTVLSTLYWYTQYSS